MSEYSKELYKLERQYINKILTDGKESKALQQEMSQVMFKLCTDFQDKAMESIRLLLNLINPIDFSSSFLSALANSTHDLSNDVTEIEIAQAKDYVENLLDVDLTQVKVIRLYESVRNNSEGFCIACGENEHHIFYQNDISGIISTDLIVHELGHAAEFTISRNENSDRLLNKYSSLSEAIAYYCQFSYLAEHGTKEQRVGSFGAFFYTYLAIVTCRICMKNRTPLCDIDENLVVNDDECLAILNSYNFDAKEFVVSKIRDIKLRFPDISSLIYHEVAPRFGLVLGLFLLNKSQDFIKGIIKNNSLDQTLESLISEIIPDYHNSITELEDKFEQYFGR